MTSVVPGTSQQERRDNIVALNTAGENLIVFSCPTPQSLVSWATALRLASWEKSRIEEIYTGHLLRLSLVENDQCKFQQGLC
jgi:CCR4-NOT transcriptional complex subunit CAF120